MEKVEDSSVLGGWILLTGETGLAAELHTVVEAGAFAVDSGMAHLVRHQFHGGLTFAPELRPGRILDDVQGPRVPLRSPLDPVGRGRHHGA